MTVRDQEHVYHEVKDIFDVYIFGFEGFGIYYTDGGRDVLLGRYATLEKAKIVLAELFLAYRDLIKGKTTRKHSNGKISEKFYMP